IRQNVLGYDGRTPDVEEIKEMQYLLVQSLEGGAFAFSSGLEYAPGQFADTQEMLDLCSVLKEYNGLYISHIRDEDNYPLESINELIQVAEKNEIPAQIHHIKINDEHSHLLSEISKSIETSR